MGSFWMVGLYLQSMPGQETLLRHHLLLMGTTSMAANELSSVLLSAMMINS
ncbi:hypothetical protein Hanom_Chr03g00233021 [Helianthus anomalus]